MASVPLALVLVAAVIVPVAVTPGSFGFHGWPQRPQQLSVEAPVVVEVAQQPAAGPARSRPARAAKAQRGRAIAQPHSPAASPRRQSVPAPAATTPGAGSPGRQLAQAPPSVSAPAPVAAPVVPQPPAAVVPPQVEIPAPQVAVPAHHIVRQAREDAEQGARIDNRRGHGARHWSRGHGHGPRNRANNR
jgi:hypothetical protein